MQVFHWFRAYYLIKNQLIYIYMSKYTEADIKVMQLTQPLIYKREEAEEAAEYWKKVRPGAIIFMLAQNPKTIPIELRLAIKWAIVNYYTKLGNKYDKQVTELTNSIYKKS